VRLRVVENPTSLGRLRVVLLVVAAAYGAIGCGKEAPTSSDFGGGVAVADAPAAAGAGKAAVPADEPEAAPEEALQAHEDFVLFLRGSETLDDVAQRAGVDEATLRAASGLEPDAPTPAGTRVVVRLAPSKAAELAAARTSAYGPVTAPAGDDPSAVAGSGSDQRELVAVRVRRDEFLGLYAEWASVPLEALLAANPDLNPDRIPRGQRVLVPVPRGRRIEFERARESWHERRSGAKPAAPGEVGASGEPEHVGCARTWRLRQGDVVWKLARRWGVKVGDVQRCNKGVKLDRVTAGRTLRVPDLAKLD